MSRERVNPEQVDSQEFIGDFVSMADQVIQYRLDHGGMLPRELWLEVLRLAGSYLCLEVLPVSPEGTPVLKLRKDPTSIGGELEWEGKLHIPGTAVPVSRRAEEMVPFLVRKEIVKPGNDEVVEFLASEAAYWGFVRYYEPQRRTTADTIVMTLPVDPGDPRLQEDLVTLTEERRSQVIDQHRPVIEAYSYNPRGRIFLDTRPRS